eukprot:g6866.t1
MSVKRVVQALGVGCGAGACGLYATDEGTQRSTKFWYEVFPIYLHYRYNQWAVRDMPEVEEAASWQALHNKYAPIAKDICLDLRGFYLKNAQLLSVLSDDFIPPQYMTWFKEMQDRAPTPFAPGEAREIVERSLGAPVEELFATWEDEPCGCASIGQCHRATLKDGTAVAVKVMAPGIEQRFRSDLKTTIRFCELAMPQHVSPMKEIEKQFVTEFDYVLEAQNLQLVHDNIMPKWGGRVCVPRPISGMCTREVLVMEHVPGVKLIDGIRDQWRRYAERNGTTLEALEEEHKAKLARGDVQQRSLAEEAAAGRRIAALLGAQAATADALRFVFNWTVGWVPGVAALPYSGGGAVGSAPTPVNLGEVIELALDVHAHEIFVDGAFNGDPHPGNILLMPDGRLGLIDYGQVKKIDLQTRLNYAKLIVAINNDDEDEIFRIANEDIGNRTKNRRKDICYRLMCFYNDRSTPDILQGMNMQEFIDYCEAEDPLEHVAPDYVMPARVSLMLRGLANAFQLKMNSTDYWRPHAENLLDEHSIPYKKKAEAAANK